MKKVFLVTTLILTAALHANAEENPAIPVKLDSSGFQDVLAQTGNVYIAGQPSQNGLKRLAQDGVKTVISFRTPHEMNDRSIVPFDEAAIAAGLGMTYINIPLGGDAHPYSPDALAEFARAIDSAEGKTLIHCTVAWRASHMWAAYLTKYKGMDINEAAAHGRAVNMGVPPMEGLLGGNISYSLPADADKK